MKTIKEFEAELDRIIGSIDELRPVVIDPQKSTFWSPDPHVHARVIAEGTQLKEAFEKLSDKDALDIWFQLSLHDSLRTRILHQLIGHRVLRAAKALPVKN